MASVVENRLIGFVGNSMILPVAPGFQLDPMIRQLKVDKYAPMDLFEFLDKLYRPPLQRPSRISVPTRGVFAEAVLGSCNSCEHKDETRFWRWKESPIDEPPAIEPSNTNTRTDEAPNVAPTPFPSPVVSIQNMPAVPDPAGLGEALKVIANPNVFRDLTGLDRNQQNALDAYKTAMDTAKSFGQEASKLAQQASMKQGGIDKSLQSIQQAKDAGLIDDGQARDLSVSALKSLVGEGKKDGDSLTKEQPVSDVLKKASEDGKDISVKRGSESVEVKTGEAQGGAPQPRPQSGRPGSGSRRRVLRVFITYPGTGTVIPGVYDVGVRESQSGRQAGGRVEYREGDFVPELPVDLPPGSWAVHARLLPIPSAEQLATSVNVPGVGLISVEPALPGPVSEETYLPKTYHGTLTVKSDSPPTIDLKLEAEVSQASVTRDFEISAQATESTEVAREVKGAIGLQLKSQIAELSGSGEVANRSSAQVSGTAAAGQKVSI
ncbi:MAG TPA: hypothetical protein VK986_07890, partial [Tepidisphaeraceae bacterium]|nr:hypothetical protein [Tepidisphaeraceae bacterium]